MSAPASNRPSALLFAGSLLGTGIFAGTFFAYAVRHQNHLPGSVVPNLLGAALFAIMMATIHFLGSAREDRSRRALTALGFALVETLVFECCLLLLLVNTFGS